MFRFLKKLSLFLVVLISITPVALADVSGDLGNFFNSLGFEGNVSSSHAYQGQEAGYYSLGSTYLRNQVRDVQIVHLDAPTYRSGCGGIDLFLGGFSFINSQNLTQFFQKVMSDSVGYAFNLAMETEVPEITHVMQYMQSVAQATNNSNLNSCDMSEDLVGGLWPQTRASQQQVCEDIGSQNNYFSDWAAARQGCTTGDDFSKEMTDASSDPRYKARVLINKNLIWDVIRNMAFLSGDQELAELFQSLSGTVIYDANGQASVLPPLADNRHLIKSLLNGGTAEIYLCDEPTRCLNPSKGTITISAEDGLNQQTMNMMNTLVTATQTDAGLTDEQKGFLNSVTPPILKIINVSLESHMGSSALDLTDYSDLISKELLKQYLLEALDSVKQSLTSADYTPVVKKQLADQIQQALTAVEEVQLSSHHDLQDTMSLMEDTKFLEKSVTANLSDNLKDNLALNGVQS